MSCCPSCTCTGDFDLALRGLLGEDAPLSAATVSRLKKK
jgi:hypothetical protein